MLNFLSFFKKPIVWIYILVVYIWILAISVLFVVLSPTFIVAKIADNDDSISFTELKTAFLTYTQEAANRLNLDYNFVLYSYISNVLIFTSALIIGFFVLRKKMWARNAIIALIIIILVYPLVFYILFLGRLPDIFNLKTFFSTLIWLGMIYFLTRKNTKTIFQKVDT